ncbi:ribonuclease domain-containing protein [Actinosynnema sp. NPDC051121]
MSHAKQNTQAKGPSKPAGKKPALAKTKRKPPPSPEAKRVTAMKTQVETTLNEVYRKGGDRDDPATVLADLLFDRAELHRLAGELAAEAEDLSENRNIANQERLIAQATGRLQDRLRPAREVAAKLKRVEQRARNDFGITVGTDLLTTTPWASVLAEVAKPKPAPKADGSESADSRLADIDRALTAVKERLDTVGSILGAINRRPNATPIRTIPATLHTVMTRSDLRAEKRVPDIFDRLKIMELAVVHEPDPARLHALLLDADSPKDIPELLKVSKGVDADLAAVLSACRYMPDTAGWTGQTIVAAKLLKTIVDSKRKAAFFLTGNGGQRLGDLRDAGSEGAPVWAGATVTGVQVGPPNQTTLTVDDIIAAAMPLHQVVQNQPGGVVGDRYVGGAGFVNIGVQKGMILPKYDNATKSSITYREYDIRPFSPTEDRGPERVVVGSDGTRYYTPDHYQTFGKLI